MFACLTLSPSGSEKSFLNFASLREINKRISTCLCFHNSIFFRTSSVAPLGTLMEYIDKAVANAELNALLCPETSRPAIGEGVTVLRSGTSVIVLYGIVVMAMLMRSRLSWSIMSWSSCTNFGPVCFSQNSCMFLALCVASFCNCLSASIRPRSLAKLCFCFDSVLATLAIASFNPRSCTPLVSLSLSTRAAASSSSAFSASYRSCSFRCRAKVLKRLSDL